MSKIRFMYLRDRKNQPVACLSFVHQAEAETVSYALSFLNPKDTFNRKVARDLAVGRLAQEGISLDLSNIKEVNHHTLTRCILTDLLTWDDEEIPSRAYRAAKRWLTDNQDFQQAKEQTNKVVFLFGGKSSNHNEMGN